MADFDDGRRWLSFDDPHEERTWMFDITFLVSSWACIYGRGCPGIEPEPAPDAQLGCCNHGAWLSDDADRTRVLAKTELLTPDEWQFRAEAERRGGALYRDRGGDWRTRRADGACIYLNRADFAGGAGCALHSAALRRGERFIDWKPEVCWQAPLRREDHETVTGHIYSMVRAWHVRDWGGDRADFGWWCVHEAEAFVAPDPVYETLRDELIEICGEEIYEELVRRIAADEMPADVVTTAIPDPVRR
jgi:hypothetical protein